MSLTKTTSRLALRRFAPVLLAVDLGRSARDHWQVQLTARQRKRFIALVRKSGGNPRNLNPRQRKELFSLVRAFGPVSFAKRQARTTVGLKTKKRSKALSS